jgi:hypothetical protein
VTEGGRAPKRKGWDCIGRNCGYGFRRMFLATANKSRQLVYLHFIGRVTVADLDQWIGDIPAVLAEMRPGFKLVTDLTHLEWLEPDGRKQIGKSMELCDEKGMGLVVRVIPDPRKDIGMNILERFHYRRKVHSVTCKNLVEAGKVLGL